MRDRPVPTTRPWVTTNFAMSVDGKVTFAEPGPFGLSSREDKRRMAAHRAEADAVLWGAGTALADEPFVRVRRPEWLEARRRRGQPPHPLNVLLTASARVPLTNRFFAEPDLRRLVVVTDAADAAALAAYRTRADVLVQAGRIDLPALLTHLRTVRGVRHLLCEGGPTLLWSLFEADLVDEVLLTLLPVVIGGERARTMVEGAGFLPGGTRRLEVVDIDRVGDEIFLAYRVAR